VVEDEVTLKIVQLERVQVSRTQEAESLIWVGAALQRCDKACFVRAASAAEVIAVQYPTTLADAQTVGDCKNK
jgi:hypothetical protein